MFGYFLIQFCCCNLYNLEIDLDFMVLIYFNLLSEYDSFNFRNFEVI